MVPDTFTVIFTVNETGSVIEVKDSLGDIVTEDSEGEYILEDGVYTYTVTKDGFEDLSDEFTIDGSDLGVDVTLIAKTYSVTFSVNEEGSIIEVKDSEGEVVGATDQGEYDLVNGSYTYAHYVA